LLLDLVVGVSLDGVSEEGVGAEGVGADGISAEGVGAKGVGAEGAGHQGWSRFGSQGQSWFRGQCWSQLELAWEPGQE